jgi:hypothetical protein
MTPQSRQLPAYIPLVVLALALLVLFYRLFLGESFIWGLPTLQFYPWRTYALELLSQGQLPLWNPYNGAGAPLFANYQSALLYPFNWLSLALPLAPTMSITSVVHLFIAGWGMWMLGGRLGYSVLGRGMSALAFGMTSYLIARLGTFPMISAAAWLPWLCWATLGIVTPHRRLDAAWLAFFTALLLLAGHAQTAWYSLLLTSIFALWRWLRERPLRPIVLVGLGASVVLGAGVAALQLAATGELLLTSQRAGGVERDFGLNFSYGLARTFNLLSPNIFGTPADGSYFTEGAFFEDAVYIGLIPLVSAIAALIAWLRLRRSQDKPIFIHDVPFWWAIVLIAFVFALGKNTPIFPFLYENIPTFDLFQAPVRWHLWTVFSLSLLAGAGVAAWGRSRRARRWAGRLTAICAALALVGFIGAFGLEGSIDPNQLILLRSVFVSSIIGVIGGILTRMQPETTSAKYPRWTLAALVLVAIDLVWAANGLNPTLNADFTRTEGDPSAPRTFWTSTLEEEVKYERYFPFEDYPLAVERWNEARNSGLPNLNLLDGQPQLNNFDPLRAGVYQQYLELIETEGADTNVLLAGAHVGAVYVEDGSLVPLETPTQRAWLVEAACWHEDDASVRAALIGDWIPTRQVHLSGAGDCAAPAQDAAPVGEITAFTDESNFVTVSVQVERPSWLVVADTYYPGWRAEVNGSAALIYRANLAFRAVAVTSETQTVRFIYQPAWLFPGALISGVALFVLLVLFRVGMNETKKND